MRKNPIGIIGYGELGQQLELLARACGWENKCLYFDDIQCEQGKIDAFPFRDYQQERFKDLNFLVGVGYKNLPLRRQIFRALAEGQRAAPSLIHPSAFIHPSAEVADGVYAYPMCNVDKNVILERGVLLNNSVVVSHDSRVGEASFLSPGVVLAGFCQVGRCTFIGAGSVVSNEIRIGEGVTVGIGTVVSGHLEPGKFYIGNPMKEVKHMDL